MIGTTLSHYTIEAELGRGGMGIVYKARDSKLDRTVAIKVLPSAALASKDDRERFYREAKSAAQLHHPNIASVFEIDEAVPEGGDSAEPRPFIAMEYIAGGTLQEKIQEKPLSLPDAVKIASQVAEALKAAHAKDIVHRDIKSANVMITGDGVAKVLDFGLAKTNQSTMLTRMGSTLGTVSYMSPEQARGQDVDGRTDLYSLGTMLYEMVAGRLPFAGEYEQAVVYSILNEPPEPLTSLRTGVPMQLEWIVNKLMAKDADYRYQTAADLLADLKALDLSGSGMTRRSMPAATVASMAAAPVKQGSPAKIWLALPVVLVLGLALGIWAPWAAEPKRPVSMDLVLKVDDSHRPMIPSFSSDGRYVAYSVATDGFTGNAIRIHDLVTGENRALDTGAYTGIFAVKWSPDDAWILFNNQPGRWRWLKISPRGGSPIELAPRSDGRADWSANGDLLYANDDIWLAPEDGTEIKRVIARDSLNGEQELSGPSYASEDVVLYSAVMDDGTWMAKWADLDSGEGGIFLRGAAPFKYLDAGFLLYVRVPPNSDGNFATLELTAQRFDLDTKEVYGSPLLLNNVYPMSDVSTDGTLIAAPGLTGFGTYTLFWLSPDGSRRQLPVPDNTYDDLAVSPDGAQLAIEVTGESNSDIFLYDLRSGAGQRFTFDGSSADPAFNPDGRIITFSASIDGKRGIYTRPVDGSRPATKVVDVQVNNPAPEFFPDGKRILYGDVKDGKRWLHILDLETGESTSVPGTEQSGASRVSPNGKYICLVTIEGIQTVAVVSPDGTERFEVAGNGAHYPRFSHDGKKVFYRRGSSYFYRDVETEPRFRLLGEEVEIGRMGGGFDHFPSPTDDRVLISSPSGLSNTEGGKMRVVTNWVSWLEEQLPKR